MKLLFVFGTRPEAVKLAPVLRTLKSEPAIETRVCVTGQHRDLLDQVLDFFSIEPDFDLDLMEADQALNPLVARLVERLDPILAEAKPDRVVVQGDTSSALAAALAAFHRGVPVAHVEAGLRTYRADQPFPEEYNRRAIGLIADLHFAPTRAARDNLVAEQLRGDVFVTGNSGVDALDLVLARLEADAALWWRVDAALPMIEEGRKLVAVTAHRRESFGAPFGEICGALARLAERPDVEILFPLHPNPELRAPAEDALGGLAHVHLLPPLDLPAFVGLMQRAQLILTDSGGVQEEAVALGKPVLVMRDVTERPEGVAAGAAILVGTDAGRILEAAEAQLEAPESHRQSQIYGDGRASERIVAALLGRPVDEFARDWPRIEPLQHIGLAPCAVDGADFLIIGGGIAGLSAAARLARHGRAIVIEAEDGARLSCSGRSVSFSHYGIGNAAVRGLTAHSRPFFEAQPEGFCTSPISRPVPSLYFAAEDALPALAALEADMAAFTDAIRPVGAAEMAALCPVAAAAPVRGLLDPTALKLDADALLQSYARRVRGAGGEVRTGQRIEAIERRDGAWVVDGSASAPVLVNAAGAWADRIAALAGVKPLGLQPRRRTDHRRRSARRHGRRRLAVHPQRGGRFLHAAGGGPDPRLARRRGGGRPLRRRAGRT